MNLRMTASMVSAVAMLSACGGNDGSNATDPNSQPLSVGSHKLVFSAISTAHLDVSIRAIDVAVKLPAGLSISTVTGDGTGQITTASIIPGSAVQTTSLAFGNYSASTRTAYLVMATTQDSYRRGQYLNLLFTVASGTSITPNDIFTLNATFPSYKVVGLDTTTLSTVTMTGKVKTTLGVEK